MVVGRGYFSHDSSHSENVASASSVGQPRQQNHSYSCIHPVACSIETFLNSSVIFIQESFDLLTLVFA